ncbi:MAG: hypothetical protein SPJ89_10375 [Treponema sp.]|nr:hypothetical protein [Spirochaetales bacterium]MDD7610113.1 hypothetical protein [Spirochaetales bacterium]MDY5812373.1 hypothetical protein [Treponema sp.]MDY5913997.1 hypothetical protein [Treponema sp.]
MSNKVFPAVRDENEEKYPPEKNKLSRQIFGNRFLSDQNLYEYLIEFLLIFVSAKEENGIEGKFKFHDSNDSLFSYYVQPRLGLKRFIFYNYSKKDKSLPQDRDALKLLWTELSKKIDSSDEKEKKEIIESLQDFFYGYAVILKKRSWCAQAIMPLCPELVFCETSPNLKKRKKNVDWENDKKTIDTKFGHKQRNFLARGGELYYLHLLQGLENRPDDKKQLELLLKNLMTGDSKKISNIASFIQNTWEKAIGATPADLQEEFSLDFIPVNAYKNCEDNSISELLNYLSCQLPVVRRLDLLAKGIMFQVMRMMSVAVASYLESSELPWIIDVCGSKSFKKFCHKSYKLLEESFDSALNKAGTNSSDKENTPSKKYEHFRKEKTAFAFGIFKSKGKELHCIIPTKGQDERFSISEDIVSFLVLSIIPPEQQMTFDMFLEKIYEHYKIVVSAKEFSKSTAYTSELANSLSKSFEENSAAFEKLLNSTGYLIELSDATSVVQNPYKRIEIQENK